MTNNNFANILSTTTTTRKARQERKRKQGRILRIEELENREMLDAGLFGAIKDAYADLDLGNDHTRYNFIEISADNLSATALRNAITQAGNTTQDDIIVVHTTETQNSIILDGTELAISIDAAQRGSITIVSLGTDPLTIDANRLSNVFYIYENTTAAFAGLTITGGGYFQSWSDESGYWEWWEPGNGILNEGTGTLVITKSTITGNTGTGIKNFTGTMTISNSSISGNTIIGGGPRGGGIENGGIMTVTNSIISGNTFSGGGEEARGGGIENSGIMTVTNSIIANNSVVTYTEGLDHSLGAGGGISNVGTITIVNSIISGNHAGGYGGGIYNDGTMTVANTTIANNHAPIGGGIFHYSHNYGGNWSILNNAIVAGNTATLNSRPQDWWFTHSPFGAHDVFDAIDELAFDELRVHSTLSGRHNLIGNSTGQSVFVNGVNGNLVGSASAPINPMFVSSTDFRLTAGSPAINAGNNGLIPAGVRTDLDGNARIANGTVDIGAYEYGSTPLPPVPPAEPVSPRGVKAQPRQATINSVTLTWTGNDANATYQVTGNERGKSIPLTGLTINYITENNRIVGATISGLEAGKRYTFTVAAFNAEGKKAAKDVRVNANTLTPKQATVKASAIRANATLNSTSLRWTIPASGIDGYEVRIVGTNSNGVRNQHLATMTINGNGLGNNATITGISVLPNSRLNAASLGASITYETLRPNTSRAVDTMSVKFEGLMAGTTYRFEIYTTSGGTTFTTGSQNREVFSRVSAATLRWPAVRSVKTEPGSRTADSVALTWSLPRYTNAFPPTADPVTHYQILLAGSSTQEEVLLRTVSAESAYFTNARGIFVMGTTITLTNAQRNEIGERFAGSCRLIVRAVVMDDTNTIVVNQSADARVTLRKA